MSERNINPENDSNILSDEERAKIKKEQKEAALTLMDQLTKQWRDKRLPKINRKDSKE